MVSVYGVGMGVMLCEWQKCQWTSAQQASAPCAPACMFANADARPLCQTLSGPYSRALTHLGQAMECGDSVHITQLLQWGGSQQSQHLPGRGGSTQLGVDCLLLLFELLLLLLRCVAGSRRSRFSMAPRGRVAGRVRRPASWGGGAADGPGPPCASPAGSCWQGCTEPWTLHTAVSQAGA